MRWSHAVPCFISAFALGMNVMGVVGHARDAARDAATSVTTVSSGTVSPRIDPLAQVQAKTPKGDPFALRFELARTKLRSDGLTAVFVKPGPWKADHEAFPTAVKPVGKKLGETGWMSHLDVGTSCDGACVPKDWAAIIEKNAKDAVPNKGTVREERLPAGRLLRWSWTEEKAYVYAAWFVPGASRMYTCSAWLDEAGLVPYVDAFVEICRTAQIDG